MNDAQFESLLRMVAESASLDEPGAEDVRTADCPDMFRLELLASVPVSATDLERRHLLSCRLCSSRLAAFRETQSARVLQFGSGRRQWRLPQLGAIAAAACLALLLLSMPRGNRAASQYVRSAAPAHAPPVVASQSIWSTCFVGDADCDGKLTSHDLVAFLTAITDPDTYRVNYPTCDLVCVNDANCDGQVNDSDIEPFLEYVAGT